MSVLIEQQGQTMNFTSEPWVILSDIERSIKAKIEKTNDMIFGCLEDDETKIISYKPFCVFTLNVLSPFEGKFNPACLRSENISSDILPLFGIAIFNPFIILPL